MPAGSADINYDRWNVFSTFSLSNS